MWLNNSSGFEPPDTVEASGTLTRRKLDVADLMMAIVDRGATLRVRVTGRSMAPFLNSGDVVTIQPAGAALFGTGTLILFKNNQDRLVLHRIVRKRQTTRRGTVYLTKGDALRCYDEPVAPGQVVGKIVRIDKKNSSGKTVSLDLLSRPWVIRNRFIADILRLKAAIDYRSAYRIPQTVKAIGNHVIRWLQA